MFKAVSILLMTFSLLLPGCKIEVTVPDGGKVVSTSGDYECDRLETCVVEVNDTGFDQPGSASLRCHFDHAVAGNVKPGIDAKNTLLLIQGNHLRLRTLTQSLSGAVVVATFLAATSLIRGTSSRPRYLANCTMPNRARPK